MGLFDLDKLYAEKNSRAFLKRAEAEGRVVSACHDIPSTVVLVGEDFGNTTVYLSSRSSQVLKKRMNRTISDWKEENVWKKKI